uniref:Uncharacterized protein n=1 Tax=Aliivibrio fischeri TaxID=668 RepID=H2ES77_ALIFS|nr:hypothetical protein [Aliivibrio fischeri]
MGVIFRYAHSVCRRAAPPWFEPKLRAYLKSKLSIILLFL